MKIAAEGKATYPEVKRVWRCFKANQMDLDIMTAESESITNGDELTLRDSKGNKYIYKVEEVEEMQQLIYSEGKVKIDISIETARKYLAEQIQRMERELVINQKEYKVYLSENYYQIYHSLRESLTVPIKI